MLSFIIPAKNEEKYIAACLRSIYKNVSGVEFEVIVVDNNSTDATRTIVAREFPQVRLVSEPRTGTNLARQCGVAASCGEILAFLDADVHLPQGWHRKVAAKLEADPRVVAVSGPYRFYDFPWYWNLGNEFVINFVLYPWCVIFIDWLKLASQMTGGDMAIRRSALEQIGGFDTNLKFYGDDTETAEQLSQVGRVVFSPRFWVYSSARRYLKKGVVRTLASYAINYFWTLVKKRPYNQEEEEVVR